MAAPPVRQLALQGAAVILVLSLAWPYFGWRAEALPWGTTSAAIGGVAALLATVTRQPWWWRLIHAGFLPLVWATHQLAIDPGWFLLAFILLLLVYRGALSGQVPLYLSNTDTLATLDSLLAERPSGHFVDLGAGLGSTVVSLADRHPDWRFTGVENAPLTWLAGRVLVLGRPHIGWRYGDLWKTPLGEADVVYAFLSPAPMPGLWEKVQSEMPPGSLFISNSFPVPGVAPTAVIEVPCTPPRPLYLYRR